MHGMRFEQMSFLFFFADRQPKATCLDYLSPCRISEVCSNISSTHLKDAGIFLHCIFSIQTRVYKNLLIHSQLSFLFFSSINSSILTSIVPTSKTHLPTLVVFIQEAITATKPQHLKLYFPFVHANTLPNIRHPPWPRCRNPNHACSRGSMP